MPDLASDFSEETEPPLEASLSQTDVESVEAEVVRMHQSNAGTVNGGDVDLTLSAAGMVNAQGLSAKESAIGGVNAEEAHIWNSAVGGVRATMVNAQGLIGAVAGENVTVEGARVGVAVAQEVRGGRVDAVVLLAGRVEGDVHTVVNTRGALIAGLVGGLFAGMILLVGRIAFHRD